MRSKRRVKSLASHSNGGPMLSVSKARPTTEICRQIAISAADQTDRWMEAQPRAKFRSPANQDAVIDDGVTSIDGSLGARTVIAK